MILSDEDVLSAMLTSVDDRAFRSLLISMSFIDSSPSSVAVQQALYALIALYVYGRAQAIKFKVHAIKALNQSTGIRLSTKDGLQRIVAGLLLSIYEVRKRNSFIKNTIKVLLRVL
jgi:hypothetical protein